jgi:hypothetical protein
MMNWLDSQKGTGARKDNIPTMLNESYCRSYQLAFDFIKRHAVDLKNDSSVTRIITEAQQLNSSAI